MQLIGEFIRQVRRKQNLTQTELGGDRFSKSYVSAVERDKIEPSQNALTFFAEQLGLATDYFTNLLQQPERQMQVFIPSGKPGELIRSSMVGNEHIVSNEELALLDSFLESTELYNFSAHYDLPTLSPEILETLPTAKQARYYFLMGLIAQEKRDLSTALQNLEAALVFAQPRLQVAILDELGINYYLAQSYTAALRYHLRALNLLLKEPPSDTIRALQFKVQFHCGNDYRALEAYEQACEHYELARMSLNPDHDIKTAASLYQGLGYCTYAAIYQKTAPTNGYHSTPEEMEREFQHALDYYLQSRVLYQVSGDKIGEATVRLTFALAKINFSLRRRQFAGKKTGSSINTPSLLNDAEEQCRQVLMSWQYLLNDSYSSDEVDTIIYVALSHLIRIYTQRSMLAQRDGYADTALRERILATNLCQQMLDTLSENTIPWTLVHSVVNSQLDGLKNQDVSLPRLGTLPNFSSNRPSQFADLPHSLVSYIEAYFAAAEVTEELGRTATTEGYSTDCYTHADRSFQAALSLVNLLATKLDSETEPGYLRNCYQRCISILDERFSTSPTYDEETTRTLLDVLLNGLNHLQSSPPSFKEAV